MEQFDVFPVFAYTKSLTTQPHTKQEFPKPQDQQKSI